MKIAIAGLAGVGAAWLIPKGGGTPPVEPSATPSDRPGVTAEVVPLPLVQEGVSVRTIGHVRVFLVRAGSSVIGMQIRSTAAEGGRVWWCPRNDRFEAELGPAAYDQQGRPLFGSAPGSLVRVRILVSAGQVTIFPETTIPGPSEPGSAAERPLSSRCSPAQRVG